MLYIIFITCFIFLVAFNYYLYESLKEEISSLDCYPITTFNIGDDF